MELNRNQKTTKFYYPEKPWPKIKIRFLILETSEVLVYIDEDFDVDWQARKRFKNSKLFYSILNEEALIESVPCGHHSEDVQIKFKRMLGEGVARAICDQYEIAHSILVEAQKFINDRNLEISRFWYLSASGFIGFLFAFGIALSWMNRDTLISVIGVSAFEVWISCCFGALGALLSIIFRIGKVKLDCNSGKQLHFLEARYRMIGGAIAGMIVGILIKSELLFATLASTEHHRLVLFGFACLGGASESLAPSLVTQFENKSKIKIR